MSHEVQPTEDMRLIKYFMTLPAIWDDISEDAMTQEEYQPSNKDQWLLFLLDNNIVGICNVKPQNYSTLEIHPVLINNYRGAYGRIAIKAFLQWIIDNGHASIKKIMAMIPVCFPKVKNCALKIGFKLEGINRQSFMKNSQLQDQWILGLTETELQECLT